MSDTLPIPLTEFRPETLNWLWPGYIPKGMITVLDGEDYLDLLSDLVEAYGAEAVNIRPVGDADLLRFLIENRQATQAEVAKEVGKRTLNRTQIGKLARYFHVGPGVFAFGG